nr:PH domain-containing protein [uncultured Microbacterium sp.]
MSPKYVVAEVILRILGLVIVGLAAAVVANWSGQSWAWFAGGVIALVLLFELAILPRQARAIGYMLRADDIVFRKGILWQRMIAVPYGRMQLVDITRGPVDRAFGIAKLKLVTAAATTGVDIPGMTEEAAEALRDTLIDVAEMRRTGL